MSPWAYTNHDNPGYFHNTSPSESTEAKQAGAPKTKSQEWEAGLVERKCGWKRERCCRSPCYLTSWAPAGEKVQLASQPRQDHFRLNLLFQMPHSVEGRGCYTRLILKTHPQQITAWRSASWNLEGVSLIESPYVWVTACGLGCLSTLASWVPSIWALRYKNGDSVATR